MSARSIIRQRTMKTVTVPACIDHAGIHSMQVTLVWSCPECGGARGEPYQAISWDGSRRLFVDSWVNPCGHIDKYRDVRKEYAESLAESIGTEEGCI